MPNTQGLFQKYTVINNDTGQLVQWPAFVLNVEGDFHARTAIIAYARSIVYSNPSLAGELGDWIERLNDEQPLPQPERKYSINQRSKEEDERGEMSQNFND